jgi:hypothetical protein
MIEFWNLIKHARFCLVRSQVMFFALSAFTATFSSTDISSMVSYKFPAVWIKNAETGEFVYGSKFVQFRLEIVVEFLLYCNCHRVRDKNMLQVLHVYVVIKIGKYYTCSFQIYVLCYTRSRSSNCLQLWVLWFVIDVYAFYALYKNV